MNLLRYQILYRTLPLLFDLSFNIEYLIKLLNDSRDVFVKVLHLSLNLLQRSLSISELVLQVNISCIALHGSIKQLT